MMKIINSTVVALLLCGSAWAGDGSFYISDPSVPNDISYVQRQGDVYYVSGSGDQQLKAIRSRLRAESAATQARIDRLLAE
jgi:sugar lactone lactonase YvrE